MKKHWKYAVWLVLGWVLMGMAMPKDDCKETLDFVSRAGKTFGQSESFYLEYTCTNVFDGVPGKPMLAKYWKEGNRMQFLSDPISMYCDGKNMVRILDTIQVVVIQNALSKTGSASPSAVPQPAIDSLLETACGISCIRGPKNGKISLDFLPQKGRLVPYRSIVITYDLQSGEMLQADYTYFPDFEGVVQEDRYVFLKRKTGHVPGMFSTTALEQVLHGQQAKPQYSNYEIQDLRTLASNFSK